MISRTVWYVSRSRAVSSSTVVQKAFRSTRDGASCSRSSTPGRTCPDARLENRAHQLWSCGEYAYRKTARAVFLYAYSPHDQSWWARFSNLASGQVLPGVLLLLQLAPSLVLRNAFWTTVLLLTARDLETYQTVRLIIRFKATQFVFAVASA